MDALPAQVVALVERLSGLCRARLPDGCDDLGERALRRRTTTGKLEARGLVQGEVAETADAHGDPDAEVAPARRSSHLDERDLGLSDAGTELARVQRFQAHASPPEAGEDERGGKRERPEPPEEHACDGECYGGKRDPSARHADDERGSKPRANGTGEEVWRAESPEACHRSTRSRSCSRRAGPIPGTASSSSTDENAPFFVR